MDIYCRVCGEPWSCRGIHFSTSDLDPGQFREVLRGSGCPACSGVGFPTERTIANWRTSVVNACEGAVLDVPLPLTGYDSSYDLLHIHPRLKTIVGEHARELDVVDGDIGFYFERPSPAPRWCDDEERIYQDAVVAWFEGFLEKTYKGGGGYREVRTGNRVEDFFVIGHTEFPSTGRSVEPEDYFHPRLDVYSEALEDAAYVVHGERADDAIQDEFERLWTDHEAEVQDSEVSRLISDATSAGLPGVIAAPFVNERYAAGSDLLDILRGVDIPCHALLQSVINPRAFLLVSTVTTELYDIPVGGEIRGIGFVDGKAVGTVTWPADEFVGPGQHTPKTVSTAASGLGSMIWDYILANTYP